MAVAIFVFANAKKGLTSQTITLLNKEPRTQTMMLPDFVVEDIQSDLDRTIKFAEDWEAKPYECIGYMRQALSLIKRSINMAVPTKTETYY